MTRERSTGDVPSRAEIAATFDAIAEEFDASRSRPWRETVAFAETLPARSLVLDLGCGGGRNATFLAGRGHRVVGIDLSPRLLSRAAAKVGTGSLALGDLVALPFRDGAFDAVHAVAVLHHIPSEAARRGCVAEIGRVLRGNGAVLASVWAHDQDRFRSGPPDVEVPWRRSDGRSVPRFYHLFRTGEMEGLVSAADLAVTRSWREGDNLVVIAAKR